MEFNTLAIKPKINTKTELLLKDIRVNPGKTSTVKEGVLSDLIGEAGEEVYNYLEKFKITQSQNILYLSLIRHYLYDAEELSKVNTIIDFKLLNRIPRLKYFLVTMNQTLPIDGYFVGCFLDYKKQKEGFSKSKHSILGHLFLMTYVFLYRFIPKVPVITKFSLLLNHGKLRCITKDETKELLKNNGFKVVSTAEIEGFTYFISQKISQFCWSKSCT